MKWSGASIRNPRVVMRVIIGILLVANLAAAVVAFKPFGGSAEDLRQNQQSLQAELTTLRARLAKTKQVAERVETARTQGDQFLAKYFLSERSASASLLQDLDQMATEAGIKMGQASFQPQEIEGSDTLYMLSIQAGFEGSYANLTKFMNLVDKSPRFLIIEGMRAAAPQQQGQQRTAQPALNVTLKIDSFVNTQPGAPI